MKKKLFLALILVTSLLVSVFCLVGCGETPNGGGSGGNGNGGNGGGGNGGGGNGGGENKTFVTVTFDTDGGTEIDDIVIDENFDFSIPEEPEKEGYSFGTWTIDGEPLNIDLFDQVFEAYRMVHETGKPVTVTVGVSWRAIEY